MKRRNFLTLLGCSAVAWPLAAHAQQRDRMRRIGVLMNLAADDPESPARIAAFAQGLADRGWSSRALRSSTSRTSTSSGNSAISI
jgi:putative tryptophan/tyrosine transport system substrate-binding protein